MMHKSQLPKNDTYDWFCAPYDALCNQSSNPLNVNDMIRTEVSWKSADFIGFTALEINNKSAAAVFMRWFGQQTVMSEHAWHCAVPALALRETFTPSESWTRLHTSENGLQSDCRSQRMLQEIQGSLQTVLGSLLWKCNRLQITSYSI